ncbi:hypothetical protein SAMN04490243_2870 [Robiginitalea myxolifaciens]|uniref:Uncharacterized protein n=1 Tax=Robiginitalea myxolifaciens TaxID=400055 RepID=A0A1I6HLU4_9FLAO|nr:DUF6544 family protein [Robiginitalea myxolifaciens]SFR55250.1 hypothetical protein SAMN04490243_2870 [Robiginitalea myxolifaciens]
MRIALIILIGIHAIIHLFGFFKAFGIAEFNAISQPISKTFGILWLVAFLLFVICAISFFTHSNYWWLIGFSAVILSQVLIFNYWSDAKYGTVANLIILTSVIIAYAGFNFQNKVAAERKSLLEKSEPVGEEVITGEAISELPSVIQKWLINSGTVGKSQIYNVHLVQEIRLKMKPEQSAWNNGLAEQYFTVQPPAFNWNINTQMNSILPVVGRDQFADGKGEMKIKLLSLIPVVDVKNDEKVNQATLQRYLAEIVWFPSASLNRHIKWETIDAYSARATMEYKGTKGSGIFHFNEYGNFEKFVAMRYKDSKDADPIEWIVTAIKIEEINGIKIPTECEASWNLETGKWTWLKLKIKQINYNLERMPVDSNG